MRLLLDEMYPPGLAARLRDSGWDVVSVLDAAVGPAAQSDARVLAWAAADDRVVVTENVQDFAKLAATHPHRGLVLVPHRRFPRSGDGLHRLEQALTELLTGEDEQPPGAVRWLG